MRKQALFLGGACVAFPLAALGCSLVASLDGLAGNVPDAAVGSTRDSSGATFDGAVMDTGGTTDTSVVSDAGGGDTALAPDTGTTPDDGALADAAVPEADAPAADAPHDVVTEPPPVAPIAFVQIAAASPPGMVASVTAKLAQAQAAGDLDVVAVGWNDATSTISQVTDTSGNAYVLAVGTARVGVDLSQAIYYAKNIAPAAAGANSVTVSFVQPANVVDLRVAEYSGLAPAAPLDKTATGTGTSAGPAASASLSTTTARELLFAAGMTTDIYTAAGPGFSMRLVSSDGNMVEDRTVSATGTYSATAPVGVSCEWIVQLATFH